LNTTKTGAIPNPEFFTGMPEDSSARLGKNELVL